MLSNLPVWLRFFPVFLLILLSDSLFVVNQITQALVLRFGEYSRVYTDPGLKVKIPFIEEVISYEKRVLDYDLPSIYVTTQDQKRLVVNTYTRYKISDPLKFFQSVKPASEVGARLRLEAIISSSVRNVLGRVELRTMLRKERSENMHKILEDVRTLSAPLGITIVDVRIIRTELPNENRNAVFARMNSELVLFAKENRAKGEQAAIAIRATADKERTILLAEANRKAEEIRGSGDAKAIEIATAAYGADPDFYEFYRTLESYKHAIKPGSSFLLSTNNDYTKNLTNYLPRK